MLAAKPDLAAERNGTRRLSIGLAALTILFCPLVFATAADAHANLLSSSPAANAALSKSPARIDLTFSEVPDPKLSRIEVVDAEGHAVAGVSSIETVVGYPGRLRVTLSRPLSRGVYTVDWRSVSTTDGHVLAGAFPFGVGVVPPPTTRSSPSAASPALEAVSAAGRWSFYWGLALLLGAATTCLIALGGVLPAGGRTLLYAAVLAAGVGISVLTLAERATVGVPSLLPLFATREGQFLLAQGVMVGLCGVAAAGADFVPRRSTLALVGATAALAMLVHTLAGHANAPAPLRPAHLAEQWVHMMAVGAWVGGLVWLLLGMRGMRHHERSEAVKRYSGIAGVALGVVALTGLLRAVSEVGTVGSLFATSYGRTLLIKVSLVAVLALLGGLNRFRLVPALTRRDDAVRPFRRAVTGEVAVATGVLALTAVLVGLAPAFVSGAPQTAAAPGVTLTGSDYATTVTVHLTVTPGTVGRNEFVLAATEYGSDKPLTGVRSVQLDFSLPAQPSVGQSAVNLSRAAGGSWRATAIEPSIAGDWSIEVVVQGATNAVVVHLTMRAAPAPRTSSR
jgi:copper transport protein